MHQTNFTRDIEYGRPTIPQTSIDTVSLSRILEHYFRNYLKTVEPARKDGDMMIH